MIWNTLPKNISSSQKKHNLLSPTVLTIKSNFAAPSRWIILFQRKKYPANTLEWKSEESVASTETEKVIIFEWPHWPVRENIAVYQVVVLHVNTSDQEIGKQAKIRCEGSNFQECKCFKKPPPTPALLCCGTLASALTQHNKASGSDIPLSEPVHATEVIQHSTCFHM